MPVTVRDILQTLAKDGWVEVACKGSHRQFKHPTKSGRVTVAGKRKQELHPKTAASILKQAGLD
ncbi:MAG: type II toxin-antitoxin system HicA family toxin [Planctomycetota bacterium]|jgi:predicted RNA binding protein YcfA (HicA-like mRNA interferase family)